MKHFSVQEIAIMMGRSPRTIRDWIEVGCKTHGGYVRLGALKVGRWWSVSDEDLVLFRHRLKRQAAVERPNMVSETEAHHAT